MKTKKPQDSNKYINFLSEMRLHLAHMSCTTNTIYRISKQTTCIDAWCLATHECCFMSRWSSM